MTDGTRHEAPDALEAALRSSGAQVVAPHGRPRAERFGERVGEEHRRLVEAVAVLDDTDRALLRVSGRHPRRMLDGLVTADLGPLDEGRGVYAFVLTARGRPVAELRVLPAGEAQWLDIPAACLEGLRAHFGRYLPPIHATAEPEEQIARLGLVGPRADAALGRWLGRRDDGDGPARDAVPEDPAELSVTELGDPPGPREGWSGLRLVRREGIEGPGWDLYGDRGSLAGAWPALVEAAAAEGGGPAGRAAYRIFRVERGIPTYGRDITEENLPQETGQEERAISYGKGCYTGQEVVARIHYRGHVNRRLCGLRLPAGEDASPGDPRPEGAASGGGGAQTSGLEAWEGRELYREGRAAGRVTTAVRSPRLGAVALGYVRREVEAGERLAAAAGEEPEVEVVGLPFVVK